MDDPEQSPAAMLCGCPDVVVKCDSHGPMRHDDARRRWVCEGFSDGMRCTATITDEELSDGVERHHRRHPE